MKALVISGGGNKGAFAGGIAEYLLKDLQNTYDLFLGTSTGSLLLPLLSVGKVDKIKSVFTNVCQHDIFSSNPFRFKKDKSGRIKTSINHLNILKMFLQHKKTLGESENLRKLIKRSFTEDDYNQLSISKKKVVVTVANLSKNRVEYKFSDQHPYDDFCDWVWTSSNLVPFMSLMQKDGCDYADGGFGNFIPIKKAIELGAKEIDAIILKTQERTKKVIKSKNALDLFLNSFSFMINQIAIDNIDLAKYEGQNSKIKINYYYIPTELTDNVLVFDPKQMSQWWQDGYDYARTNFPITQDARRKIFAFFG